MVALWSVGQVSCVDFEMISRLAASTVYFQYIVNDQSERGEMISEDLISWYLYFCTSLFSAPPPEVCPASSLELLCFSNDKHIHQHTPVPRGFHGSGEGMCGATSVDVLLIYFTRLQQYVVAVCCAIAL